MAIAHIWRASRIRAVDGRGSTASGRRSHRLRPGPQLWVLLNAQALLNGTAGTQGGVAHIEDDRGRMVAQRAD